MTIRRKNRGKEAPKKIKPVAKILPDPEAPPADPASPKPAPTPDPNTDPGPEHADQEPPDDEEKPKGKHWWQG